MNMQGLKDELRGSRSQASERGFPSLPDFSSIVFNSFGASLSQVPSHREQVQIKARVCWSQVRSEDILDIFQPSQASSHSQLI